MNHFKSISLCLTVACLTASCSDSLLDLNPKTENVSDNYFKNEEQLELGVTGAYATLQYSGQYQIANLLLGELPSDNTWDEVPANDSGYCGQLDEFSMTSSNGIIEESWQDNYIGIQQCNVVLNRIGSITLDEDTKDRITGEMKFLRALMYFNLVRIFGDVPLVTTETTNTNDYFGQGRTPKADVYAQIKKDLTEAINELPTTTEAKSKASRGAAQALLGKVYLTLGEYQAAKEQLLAVEQANTYKLLDDPNEIFSVGSEGNDEVLFDVEFASGINGNTEGSDAFRYFSPSGSVNGAKGHNLPTREVYNLFSDDDSRKTAYFRQCAVHVATNKFKQTSSVIADGGSNVIVLRYADVLLMLAECYDQEGDMAKASEYLNKIRKRAGLNDITLTDKETGLNEILTERRKELVCEGDRWFDLIRTGKAVSVMNEHFKNTTGYNGITVTTDNLVQPIPLSQIDTDASIKQNNGYN